MSNLSLSGAALNSKYLLRFRAGASAFAEIRKDGFSPTQIGTIAGASGGAKWLVLSQIDRVIIEKILPNLSAPVHLLGSSVGAWRFSCYAQQDPLAALLRFEQAYLEQEYSEAPDLEEITTRSKEILGTVLGTSGAQQVVSNPLLRTHVMAVRSRFMTASDHRLLLAAGMIAAAAANLISRHALGAFFRRSLFYDSRDTPPFFSASGFPLDQVKLTAENYAAAVLASGSIPLVLKGVVDIDGAPSGRYRDGGIIDYHLDLQTSCADQITLYPHFYDHLIPGWFDKRLSWRRNHPMHVDRTVLICPSAEFIATLPNRKIPDRSDFKTMSPSTRRKTWQGVVAACVALADDLSDVLESGALPARLEPLR